MHIHMYTYMPIHLYTVILVYIYTYIPIYRYTYTYVWVCNIHTHIGASAVAMLSLGLAGSPGARTAMWFDAVVCAVDSARHGARLAPISVMIAQVKELVRRHCLSKGRFAARLTAMSRRYAAHSLRGLRRQCAWPQAIAYVIGGGVFFSPPFAAFVRPTAWREDHALTAPAARLEQIRVGTYTYTQAHPHIQIHIHTCTYIHTDAQTRMHTHTHMHAYSFEEIHMHTCM